MNETFAKQIFLAFQELKTLQKTVSGIDFQQAEALAFMKRDKNYKIIMGYDETTWPAFIAQPELQPLTVSKADRLIKIYDTYIVGLHLKEKDLEGIDTNSLQRLANIVDEFNVEKWLEKARTLSRSDLYKEIRFGKVKEEECKHKWSVKEIKTCKVCGARETTKK